MPTTEAVLTGAVQKELATLDIDAILEVTAANGTVLIGIEGDPELRDDLWKHFSSRHESTGLWPFISHYGPAELAGSASAEPADKSVGCTQKDIVRLLIESQRSCEADYHRREGYDDVESDYTTDAILAALAEQRSPAVEPRVKLDTLFSTPPGWLVLTTAIHYELPALLQVPKTFNWQGSSVHPHLTPQDHSMVLKSWYGRFGARLRYLGPSALELAIEKPPAQPDAIAEVAVEQFAYCYDLQQVLGEPADVARRQVVSDSWFFWWD